MKPLRFFLIIIFALVFLGISTSPAYAASITVTKIADTNDGVCNSDCSLREAVGAASIGDTIIFAPALSGQIIALATTLKLSKDLTIDGSALALPITISGVTTNDGTGSPLIFIIDAGHTVTLDSLTITKSSVTGYINVLGITIYSGGVLIINNCTITNLSGGGVGNQNGTLIITNSTISNNLGTGVYNVGTATLTNVVITNNTATHSGGGIYTWGNLTLIDSTISNNVGGGITNDNGSLTLTNSSVTGNSDFGIVNTYGTLTVTKSTISENSGTGITNNPGVVTVLSSILKGNVDGGILNSSTLTVVNSTIFGHVNSTGTFSAAGIYNIAGTLTILNSTFSNNVYGLYINGGTLNYANTIIANSTSWDCYNYFQPIGFNVNNLVEKNVPDWVYGSNCGTPAFTSNANLGLLADNGGPTQTMALLAGSSAINAGDTATCAALPVNNLDQRGVSRPEGSACEIGAYEVDIPVIVSVKRLDPNPTLAPTVDFSVTFSENVTGVDTSDFSLTTSGVSGAAVSGVSGSGGVYTVTVNTGIGSGTIRLDVVDNNSILDAASNPLGGPAVGDGNFGSGEFYTISKLIYANQNASGANNGISWVNAYTDLQSALLVASSGDEIWVAAGKYKPTTGTDRAVSFVLKSGVAVYGGFAGIETLRTQRNSAANVTILSGDIGAAGTADNSYHVVIGEGSVSAAVLAGFTVVSGNANGTDPNGFDFVGGGIVNFGFLNIENSIISNNSAIDNGGGIENSGTLNIVTSTVSNNSSVMGGGILNLGESLQVTNSKISGNTAMVGGGIYNVSTLNLTSSTVSSNSATIDGGGILSSGTINVENSTFVGNSAEHDGGGIASGGVDTIANSTFSNNSAVNVGGGIAHGGFPLNMSNTIIANSTSGGDCYIDITGGAAMGVGSHNLIESNAASPNNCGTPISTADPILGALANNGGFTQTFALLPGSPAINAGTDTGCPATDQRGVIRPQGSHCDIGAYELYMPQVKTITRIDVNPTVLTSVRFTVTFYESVMGVDTGDFSLTTIGGVFGASVTSVSGSGATYTVTVNTGSGRGMLRLNIVDDNSILNAASSPLGGPALGDGNFGSGEFYTINKPIQDVVTDTWAVKVSPSANVSQLALQLGAQNLGQIGSLPGYYLFRISGSNTQPKTATDLLAANPQVLWFEQQTAHKQSARGNSNQNGNPAEVITATAMIEDVQSQDNADNVSATNTPSDTVSTVPTETAITIIESSQLPAFTQTIAPLLQVLPIPTQTPIVQIQPSSIPTKPVQPTKIVVLSNKPLEIPTTMIRSAIPITGSENNSSNVGTMAAILIILTLAAGGIFFTLRYVK